MAAPLPITPKNQQRSNDVLNTGLGNTYATFKQSSSYDRDDQGSLARELEPGDGAGLIDVVNNFPWTLSKIDDEVPYIWIKEYRTTESQIKKQASVGFGVGVDKTATAVGLDTKTKDTLDVYKELFPKDHPTGFAYKFPYFNKNLFQLNTPNWQALEDVSKSLGNLASSFGPAGETIKKGGEAIGAVVETMGRAQTPAYGVADRPKVFLSHETRSITISFTLFNTIHHLDWKKNRDLGYMLMSQNLFNKRDYVTGVPPVFYDVWIPGQYFCYAAAMTNIKVEQIGNQRLYDDEHIVPDAYQFELVISELVMPSKNQFEALTTGEAKNMVQTYK